MVIGYGIATIVRPFTAAAHTAQQVLAIRLTDRIGKGIRTSPRDALLADSAPAHARGRAFGFHAAADNAGAVLGPLLAFMILKLHGVGSFDGTKHMLLTTSRHSGTCSGSRQYRHYRDGDPDRRRRDVPRKDAGDNAAGTSIGDTGGRLTKRFWAYLVVVLLLRSETPPMRFCFCAPISSAYPWRWPRFCGRFSTS